MEEKKEEEVKGTEEKIVSNRATRNRFWVGILIIIAVVVFVGVVFLYAETDFFISKAADVKTLTDVATLSLKFGIM